MTKDFTRPPEDVIESVASKLSYRLDNAKAQDRKTGTADTARLAEKKADDANTELADPDFIAQREIDLTKQAMLGRLQGSLPNVNLDTIEDAAKLGDQVVLARSMATQDAAAINLWVQDAAIESAKIKKLVADKISAGNLNVKVNLATGGGIDLGVNTEGAVAADLVDKYIGTDYAKQWVYNSTGRRGWQSRADGVSGGKNGRLTYIATRYPSATPSDTTDYAALLVAADNVHLGHAGVSVRHALSVVGPAKIGAALTAGGTLQVDSFSYLNGKITRNDGTAPIELGRGTDIQQGDLRFTDAATQTIRSTGGYPLVLEAPTSYVRVDNALRAEAGLTVVGAMTLGGKVGNNGHRIEPAYITGWMNIAANTTVDVNNPASSLPLWVEGSWRWEAGAAPRGMTGSTATTGVVLQLWTAKVIRVTNYTNATRQVRFFVWQ